MSMKSIAVIIRVFDRVEDLKHNLGIIRNTWTNNNYYIIVTSNGRNAGYVIDEQTHSLVDKLVELDGNSGHLTGNSDLLLAGIPHIPNNTDYVIILEADTWLYTDRLINRYIAKLANSNAVWASARWYDRFYSLATDFAIIDANFLKAQNDILKFTDYPECYVAEYILNSKLKYIHIWENMPVQLPGYIKKYPLAPKGRFFAYPFSQLVTHHVELVANGFATKMRHFNIVARTNYFTEQKVAFKWLLFLYFCKLHTLTLLLPKRTWLSKRETISSYKKRINA